MKSLNVWCASRRLFAAAILLATGFVQSAAQLSQGTIIVYQIGDGTSYSAGTAAPAYLIEYDKRTQLQTRPVSTVVMPVKGTGRLVNSISDVSEGYINLSADSSKVIVAGYDTIPGFTSVSSTASSSVARVVDTISALGIPGPAAITTTAFSGSAIHSATRGAAENYWGTGAASGVYYLGTTAAAASVYSAITSNRVVSTINGNLYFSTAGGSTPGIWKVTGTPLAATTAVTSLIATGTASSPFAFALNSGDSLAYVADDRTTSANHGGVYKWKLSGGTWTAVDTLKPGAGIGARGIAVDWSGSDPIVYATTTDNRLIRWVDSSNFSHIHTTLAAAPANTVFRGVTLSPKSVCSGFTASATASGPTMRCQGDSVVLTASTGTGYRYEWRNGSVFSAGDTLVRFAAKSTGKYQVTITNNAGCTATSPLVLVSINPLPDTGITLLTGYTLCAGDTIVLRAKSGDDYKYAWKLMGSFTTLPSADSNYTLVTQDNTTSPTPYTFKSIVTNRYGCTDSSSQLTVTTLPLPVPAIAFNGSTLSTGTYTSYQWFLNDTLINGATSAAYTPLRNGIYTVSVLSLYGCSNISDAFNLTSLRVPSAIAAMGIRIYPNPAADLLYIQSPVEVSVIVRDLQGRTVLSSAETKVLNVQGIDNGTYTISLLGADGALIGTQLFVRQSH